MVCCGTGRGISTQGWSLCSLVYEFVEQGSLEGHLYPQQQNSSSEARFLDWPTRENIALGTARGLIYLHDVSHPEFCFLIQIQA